MVIPENSSIVIFGASGDLTYRKLIPALYHLYANKQLPESFAILGVSRTEYSDESYREKLKKSLQEMEKPSQKRLMHLSTICITKQLTLLTRKITASWQHV